MAPVLEVLSEHGQLSSKDLREVIRKRLKVSEEDASELLASGKQTVFANRVGWAVSYLEKARLLRRVARGTYSITDRGRKDLSESREEISTKFLERYDEFLAFTSASQPRPTDQPPQAGESEASDARTPEEEFDEACAKILGGLQTELLTALKGASPAFFERFVLDVLVAMGYGGSRAEASTALGRSGDAGVDGVIKLDRLGLDVVYVQAKRWEGTVSRPTVQAFVGALVGQQAKRGIILTTSSFTKEAIAYVDKIEQSVVLIDGETLVKLAMEHGVGVVPVSTFTVKRLDTGYFEEA